MCEEFYYTAAVTERVVLRKQPKTVLEISMSGSRYGRLIRDCQHRLFDSGEAIQLDRVDISEGVIPMDSRPYDRLLPIESLDHPSLLNKYDFILIADLYERLDIETGQRLLKALSEKSAKGIIVISPGEPNDLFGSIREEIGALDIICQKIESGSEVMWFYYVSLKTAVKD
ncbi:MAG: hypothetical protein LBS84_11405 [Clostridiales bacterium]|jgi:hypothetical protein|nr:hypothetical protein [Clostridiales bacterium]